MVASICRAVMPLAYRPPTMAPMLVPAMQSTGTFKSSRTLRMPICAMPRAPPPDSTRQMRGRIAAGGACGAATAAAQDPPGHKQAAHSAQPKPRKLSCPMVALPRGMVIQNPLVHDVDTRSDKSIVAPVERTGGHEVQRRRRCDDGDGQLGHEIREASVHRDAGRARGG